MSTRTIDEAANVLADPTGYADDTRLHTALTHLRANNPVAWVDNPPYRPFWAVTKHEDIMTIERQQQPVHQLEAEAGACPPRRPTSCREAGGGAGIRREHAYPHGRSAAQGAFEIGVDSFRPKAMRAMKIRVQELARNYVDKLAGAGWGVRLHGQEVAVNFPLYVIMSMLGVPDEDFPMMLRCTQEMFGSEDEEFKRGAGPGKSRWPR